MSLLILKFSDNSCLLSNSRFTVHLQVLNINNISRTSRYLSERERWHSGKVSYLCILCLPQTYLRLWVQILSCQDCWQWTLFYLLFSLYFIFLFFFFLLIFYFRTTRVRGYQSRCHISHKTDHRTWEKEVEGSGTKWRHTA